MVSTTRPLLLIFPFGLMAHYLRCLVIAKHLKKHFEIRFMHHPAYSHFVEAEGFSTFECDGMDEAEVMDRFRDFDFSWLNIQNLEIAFLSQVIAIDRLQPAAVLGDAMPTLKMAAEYTGVKYISLINGYMSRYYAGLRSLPATHPVYPYLMQLPPAVQKFLTEQGEAMAFRKIHKSFKKLRSIYSLSPQGNYLNEMEGDLNLICDLTCLFELKKLPSNYLCIGPLIFEPESTKGNPVATRLDNNKKTIYVSMGSSGNWEHASFLNDSIYSSYNIVAAGDKEHVLNAKHIISVAFASAAEILPLADLVICHGGNGTIYQALSYGLPLLCRPAHFEQEWNVAAAEKAGLAVLLPSEGTQEEYAELIKKQLAKSESGHIDEIRQFILEAVEELPAKLDQTARAILNKQAYLNKELINLTV